MDGPASGTGGEHANEELLELYAMDRLGNPKLAEVEEHLLLCELCQARLEEIDGFVKAFRQASRQATERESSGAEKDETGKLWAWLKPMWAAGAVAAAVLAVVLVVPYRPGDGPPQSVDLRAMRSEGLSRIDAQAGRPLVLRLDTAGLELAAQFRVEVVEASGRLVWSGEAARQSRVEVSTPAMDAGTYWVRLLGAGGETLREFGLRVK